MTGKSFADLGVSNAVVSALSSRGIVAPFPVQSLVVRDAIDGHDVLVRSQTGSGKTLAFAIPIVEQLPRGTSGPAALVLVPTRELASQVASEMRSIAASRGLRVAVAYGGTSIRDQARTAKKAHILVATPGRLEDLAERRMVFLGNVSILVLDEADRMLDMGFQPQVDRIVDRLPEDRQTMLFSATLDGAVGRLAASYTYQPILHEIESPKSTVSEVTHRFVPVEAAQKSDALAKMLGDAGVPTLVFVRTKHGVDRLIKKLERRGVVASGMHGDMSQSARESSLKRFATGRASALIATDVAARGLDLDTIERVINFDPPQDDKSYVHRVGRTGRAGRTGLGITFVAPDQHQDVGQMAARLDLVEEWAKENRAVVGGRNSSKSSSARRGNHAPQGRRRRR